MDLARLNEVASYLPLKKMSDLEITHDYMLTALKKVDTKYGVKVVAHLDEQYQVFLPKRISDSLVKDKEFFNQIADCANRMQLFMKKLANNNVEFSSV